MTTADVEPGRTLCQVFQDTVARCGDRPALSAAGHDPLTWRAVGEQVEALATGLLTLGLAPGATVALLTENTPAFHVADLAVVHAGGVPYSLQGADPAGELAERLVVAGTRVVLTEVAHLPRARELAALVPAVEHVIVLDGPGAGPELPLADLARSGPADRSFDESWRAVDPEDTATLIFTSGTTGRPKAVRLPHRAITISVDSFLRLAPGGEDGLLLSYLPLTHIAERFMTYYLGVTYGAEIHCVPDPAALFETLARVRPTRFFGVPRVYAKLAARARELIAADPDSAAGVGRVLGLDRAAYRGVATAPASVELLGYFAELELPVGDIWGMSEAIMCTASPTGAMRIGTVGRLLDGVEARVADDGELLVRGPNTFTGYLGEPELTAAIRTDDGWLRTGDLGQVDADGYLTIIGRKKDLMITVTGHNVVAAVVEDAVKDASSLIDQAVAVADGRRFVTALVALDAAELTTLARRRGLTGSFAELAHDPVVAAEVAQAVGRANGRLARADTVRSWRVVAREWPPGGDEVTATMKLRRAEIHRKYADLIEDMYRTDGGIPWSSTTRS